MICDPDIRAFLVEAIDSIETLEVMIALCRAPSTKAALASSLGLADDVVDEAVAALERVSLVRAMPNGTWQLVPSARWAVAVARLHEAYERDRFEVVRWLANVALARVRSQAAQVLRPRKLKGE